MATVYFSDAGFIPDRVNGYFFLNPLCEVVSVQEVTKDSPCFSYPERNQPA